MPTKQYNNIDYQDAVRPINVPDPIDPQDAATKRYVDTVASVPVPPVPKVTRDRLAMQAHPVLQDQREMGGQRELRDQRDQLVTKDRQEQPDPKDHKAPKGLVPTYRDQSPPR